MLKNIERNYWGRLGGFFNIKKYLLITIVIGLTFIALNQYSILFVLLDIELSYLSLWMFFYAFIVGIALVIVGLTLYSMKYMVNIQYFKSLLLISLIMLTISVFGNVLINLSRVLKIAYLHLPDSLLISILARSWWLPEIIWLVGFAGWLILFSANRIRPMGFSDSNLLRVAFNALGIGAAIVLIFSMFRIVLPYLSPEMIVFLYSPLQYLYALIYPLGEVLLFFGWAVLSTAFFQKPKFIILMIYLIFITVSAIVLLMPI